MAWSVNLEPGCGPLCIAMGIAGRSITVKEDRVDPGRKTIAWLRRLRADAKRVIDRLLGEDPASTFWMAEDWLPDDLPTASCAAAEAEPARSPRAKRAAA